MCVRVMVFGRSVCVLRDSLSTQHLSTPAPHTHAHLDLRTPLCVECGVVLYLFLSGGVCSLLPSSIVSHPNSDCDVRVDQYVSSSISLIQPDPSYEDRR